MPTAFFPKRRSQGREGEKGKGEGGRVPLDSIFNYLPRDEKRGVKGGEGKKGFSFFFFFGFQGGGGGIVERSPCLEITFL